ncbi:MAG: hypothetical protein CO056_00435 [Candidatus Tagabacteria bacterium CG_4_9_14_0_2_um_filter_41_11]|uniref:Uncharacterized protein n=1 Tax=Candidatus Tagabacteria bacterium CG_4_9_14_0_2_um_filter_41_11 TaxID=1975019 RepID=A0A2M8ERN1_9BACT|nr:MAG: hypothetical protein CO056_00435 [Candidatus Tagabacteria bacterium CG_4_9_14_0_2_um_filter_41_11]
MEEIFNQNLQKRVMRRVHAIWFLKQVGPILFLEMPVLLAVGLWEIARAFFVARIVENFITSVHSGSVMAIVNFVGSAIYSASDNLVPVAIAGISLGLFMILAYKLIRNFTQLVLIRI